MSGGAWIGGNAATGSNGRLRKGPFEDIVEERRLHGDLGWVLRTRQAVPWPSLCGHAPVGDAGPPAKSPAELKREVLSSDRLLYGLREICLETGQPMPELLKEAEGVLDEMAHSLSMFAIRSFGFAVSKVMKRLYRAVYVNSDGIAQLRKACSEYPVILMPMHRSYADFLLLSLICFDYDLPLPAIASAMDFMGMKFIGTVLRNCGAFFIRRSFATDRVYWLTFVEYVKTHVRGGLHPVEFFIEGTRSRTGKSLHPKTGMLGAILESWFMCEVPDVYLVPVSISYDRILEEALYAYELLGVPKPKESTSGLLKARALLSQDFGSVHFHFDQPISLRKFADSYGGVDRGLHSLAPKVKAQLTPAESRMLQAAARHVVSRHCANAVVSPFCLMAALLLADLDGAVAPHQLSVPAAGLAESLVWLRRHLVDTCRVSVDWPSSTPLAASAQEATEAAAVVADQCRLHGDLLGLEPGTSGRVALLVEPSADLLARAATGLRLGSYRNQLMCHLVLPALSLAVSACSDPGATYETLRRLLHREFPLLSETLPAMPAMPCDRLARFLLACLRPFLIGYWLLCDTLLRPGLMSHQAGGSGGSAEREIALAVQARGFQRLSTADATAASSWECVSLDLLTNGVHGLHRLGVLERRGAAGGWPGCDWDALTRLRDLLESLIGPQADSTARDSRALSKL